MQSRDELGFGYKEELNIFYKHLNKDLGLWAHCVYNDVMPGEMSMSCLIQMKVNSVFIV